MKSKALIVIPARMGSERLPGKPLIDVNGMPLLWHTHQQASKVGCPVIVATPDQEILSYCASSKINAIHSGIDAVLTGEHWCGTARAWEAALDRSDVDVVVNWQVDEPEADSEAVRLMIASVNMYQPIFTIVSELSLEQAKQRDVTKAVIARKIRRCHWFTRTDVPGAMAHAGVYCFTKNILQQVGQLPQSPLSELESLEQLTWLENGYTIHAVKTCMPVHGINTQEDLKDLRWRLVNRG